MLAGEKKSLEISLWLEQLTKLGRQLAELEDKTLLAANDAPPPKGGWMIERELEEIQHKTQDANLYIEHKRERIKEFEDAISNAKVEAAVKQNTIDHNNDTIAELEKELERSELPPGSWRKADCPAGGLPKPPGRGPKDPRSPGGGAKRRWRLSGRSTAWRRSRARWRCKARSCRGASTGRSFGRDGRNAGRGNGDPPGSAARTGQGQG